MTNDDDLAHRARGLRDYGKPDPWVSLHTAIGSNWRMAEFCAAVGVIQLRRLDELIAWREKVARLYTEMLGDVPGVTPVLPAGRSSWYKYIVLLPKGVNRERVRSVMKATGVSLSGGVYDTPLHRQPVFAAMADGAYLVADDICSRHICLPIYYGMTDEEVRYVVDALKRALNTSEGEEAGKP